MPDANFAAWITSAAPPAYALLLGCAVLAVRFFPVWKQRWNEARKIEVDADAGFRTTLIERIRLLEERCDGDQERLNLAMAEERRRCDGELEDMRRDFEKRIDELMRIIKQNSQSAAQLIPETLPGSKAKPRR